MTKMENKDFIYCKGVGCPLSERCIHYREGLTLPEGDWKWQYDCGEERKGFLPTMTSCQK